MDSMFLMRRSLHNHIRPLPHIKATPKWYRLVRFKNLPEWTA